MPRRFAIILGGGRSARMGRDKRDLILDGRSLLARAVDACAGRDLVVVVTPDLPGDVAGDRVTRVLEDPPFGGPVAGVSAGVGALPPIRPADEVLLLACDLPRVAEIVAVLDAVALGAPVEAGATASTNHTPAEPAEAARPPEVSTDSASHTPAGPFHAAHPPGVSTSSTGENVGRPVEAGTWRPEVSTGEDMDEDSCRERSTTQGWGLNEDDGGSCGESTGSIGHDGGSCGEGTGSIGDDGVCLVDAEDYPQYLAARYHRDALEARLAAVGDPRAQSVRRLMTGLKLRRIPAPDISRDVDTPDEAAAAGLG